MTQGQKNKIVGGNVRSTGKSCVVCMWLDYRA